MRTCYQEEDGDEDFEPPAAEEEEEGEDAGVRRRNIQARELSDLLQDAFTQVRPVEASTIALPVFAAVSWAITVFVVGKKVLPARPLVSPRFSCSTLEKVFVVGRF